MGRKIRVLQLVNGEVYAGAERVQEMLLKGLNSQWFEPLCVALLEGAFVRRARALKLPVEILPMRRRWDLGVVKRLAHYIRTEGINIVHTHTVRTNLVGRLAAMRAGVPVVTHVHSSPQGEWDDGLKVRLNGQLERLTRGWSARFLCVSEGLKAELRQEGVPEERIVVVPNGLEREWFARKGALAPRKEELLHEFSLPEEAAEAAWAVLPAWVRPIKGADVFLDALARLDGGVWGLIVGEVLSARYRRKLGAQAHRLGVAKRVSWLGFQPPEKLLSILQAADVVVLPSKRSEGLPMSLLEALALGKPVIASAVGGVPELIRDGETGRLVPPDDPAALAAALREVLNEPEKAHRWGEEGYRQVERYHRAETMIRRVEVVYRDLLEACG